MPVVITTSVATFWRPTRKMLQTIRIITPCFASFKPSIPSWLLRPFFTTTRPAARKLDPQYPDDDVRRARYKIQAECHKTRYRGDPVFAAARRRKRRDLYARHKNDDFLQLYVRLRQWTRRHEWVRAQLPWKAHLPLLYADKVEHHCHGCDWTRSGGMQLWWRRKRDDASRHHRVLEDGDKSDEYLCHSCYVKQGHFDALPKGYEDVKTIKDIIARKKQFDDLVAASAVQGAQ